MRYAPDAQKRHNWLISEEWIIGTPGGQALFLAVKAFTDEEDGIIIQTPALLSLYAAAERNKRTLVENPLFFNGSTYLIDYDDLEQKASNPRNKVLLFCSPHNPVGRV